VTPASPDRRSAPADTASPLVLIVDDNDRNLRLARDVLQAAGLRTLEASSGREAVALAGESLPDVILLDLGLPDLDGTDVARELLGNPRTCRIPIVALSALRPDDDGRWLLDAGFAGYLSKPITVGAFPDQVRSYCTAARA
jgi:two-component system cell cycle response regulator DivK